MIEQYRFGLITINRETYHHDVEIRGKEEILPWRREESHMISLSDLKRALNWNPEIIIIGTGESGIAEVDSETQSNIKSLGIRLIIDNTPKAIKTFNTILEKERDKKIIGLFHLTC